MNNQTTIKPTIFQDRDLLALTPAANAPRNSWRRLTAGDERAERFESFLRTLLVVSLFCTIAICALRLRPADAASDTVRLAAPSIHLPAMIEQAPAAAVQAAQHAF